LAKYAGWAERGLHRRTELSWLLFGEWGTFEWNYVARFGADGVVEFIGSFSFNPKREKSLTDSL
jgi:hypothetical protein